jgi:hypothetical protein
MTQHVKKSPMAPDLKMAKRFLQLLDPKATAFTFQTLDDNHDRKSAKLNKVLHGSLEKHWQTLTSLSKQGAGVFVTINETDFSGRKEANIKRVRAIFVDTDGAPQEPIDEYSPHIVVETSPGRYHNYWLVKDCPLTEFKEAQIQMIEAWDTDKSINDLTRIMRLPGFPHQKVNKKKGLIGTPFLVTIVNSPGLHITPDQWIDRKPIIQQIAQSNCALGASPAKPLNVTIRDKDWQLGPRPPHVHSPLDTNIFTADKMLRVQECLPYIDPRTRHNWFDVTSILATELGEGGRQIAHQWASGELYAACNQTSMSLTPEICSYCFDDTEQRYHEALKRDASRDQNSKKTLGSLFYMAREGGMSVADENSAQKARSIQGEAVQLKETEPDGKKTVGALNTKSWLTELNSKYAWVEKQQSIYRFEFEDFIEPSKLHLQYQNDLVSVGSEDKPKVIPKSKAWMGHRDRRSHRDIVFDPTEGEITSRNAINLWTGLEKKPAKGDISPFLKLSEHMFPNASERDYVMRWLAFKLKYPGNKMNTALLVWSRNQGVGKNLLFECIRDIIGSNHSQTITQSDLKRDFNGWLKNKVLVIGDEVLTSYRRVETDKLKVLITDTSVTINEKHQPEYSVENFASFVFLSNHDDAIHIDKEDRRFFVHEVTAQPLEQSFYRSFVEWRDNGGLEALLYHLLNNVDLDEFLPTAQAPLTSSKVQMIGESLSALEEWMTDVISNPGDLVGSEVASSQQLLGLYVDLYPTQNPSPTAVRKAAIRHGAKSLKQIRTTKGNKIRVLSLSDHDKWANSSETELAKENAKLSPKYR